MNYLPSEGNVWYLHDIKTNTDFIDISICGTKSLRSYFLLQLYDYD